MTEHDDPLVEERMEEFRQVPDDWKPVVAEHVRMAVRLSKRPVVRMVGEGELVEEQGEPAQ